MITHWCTIHHTYHEHSRLNVILLCQCKSIPSNTLLFQCKKAQSATWLIQCKKALSVTSAFHLVPSCTETSKCHLVSSSTKQPRVTWLPVQVNHCNDLAHSLPLQYRMVRMVMLMGSVYVAIHLWKALLGFNGNCYLQHISLPSYCYVAHLSCLFTKHCPNNIDKCNNFTQ